ncbi:MAG: prepilin-type N-terminal cleavage/methylation domain-containing protein [Woeseia sp.]
MNARHARGYTLVELLVVVGIIALIAMIAVPQMSSNEPQQLAIAASEYGAAMRFARSEALRTGTPHGFTLTKDSKSLQVFRMDGTASDAKPVYDVRHPVSKALYHIDIDKHAFAAADAIALTATFRGTCNSDDSVRFDVNGTPRCLDSIKSILKTLNVAMKLGADQAAVNLDGLTGRVTVQ